MKNKKLLLIAAIVVIAGIGISKSNFDKNIRKPQKNNNSSVQNTIDTKSSNNNVESKEKKVTKNESKENKTEEAKVEKKKTENKNNENKKKETEKENTAQNNQTKQDSSSTQKNETKQSKENENKTESPKTSSNPEDTAIELAKKKWGNKDRDVYFSVEDEQSKGIYIVSVRDEDTTAEIVSYAVDINKKSVIEN